jgi:ELWxxDGT repeat protein
MKKSRLYSILIISFLFAQETYSQTNTTVIHDINSGLSGSAISNIIKVGNEIYFSADDGIHGNELWKSNGTITQLVADINPGSNSSNPGYLYNSNRGNMIVVNGTLFFTANDDAHGWELWKINSLGAAELVKDINPGANDGLSFVADDELSNHINLVSIHSTSTLLFFSADDGVHGWELWKSDGTSAGTKMVKEINQTLHTNNYPYGSRWGSNPTYLTAINDMLYFSATDDSALGQELWQSDGSTSGTKLVMNINENIIYQSSTDTLGESSNPEKIINANGVLYFVADEGQQWNGSAFVGPGKELWMHDPITKTTSMVKDINPGNDGSDPTNFEVVGTNLFFAATTNGNGTELWKCFLPGGSATFVKDINPTGDSNPKFLTSFNNELYFSANDGVSGTELWMSDGSPNGTILIDDIRQGASSSNPRYLTVVGSYSLYFTADDGVYGTELWETNGLLNNSIMVNDIYSGGIGSTPGYLTNANNNLYFAADDETFGWELMTVSGNPPLGFNKNYAEYKIQIYPNPSIDFIIIENKNPILDLPYIIMNSFGQKVLAGQFIGEQSKVDIRELPSGMYFIQIGLREKQLYKLIKE